MTTHASAPIGVFDSGIGGLGVLHALQQQLPHERFVYLADNACAPYGERGDAFVRRRSHAITAWLRQNHGIKALVVACNTATAAAIDSLRRRHPDLPFVGVEPALKPAAAATHTHRIGVLATRTTSTSTRFADLLAALPTSVQCVVQPCDGLAEAIENAARSGLASVASDATVAGLCAHYIQAMGPFGNEPGAMDTMVLGCTHYVFAQPAIRELVGPAVQLLDTGEPVAQQAQRVLGISHQHTLASSTPQVLLLATGDSDALRGAIRHWPKEQLAGVQSVMVPDVQEEPELQALLRSRQPDLLHHV